MAEKSRNKAQKDGANKQWGCPSPKRMSMPDSHTAKTATRAGRMVHGRIDGKWLKKNQ